MCRTYPLLTVRVSDLSTPPQCVCRISPVLTVRVSDLSTPRSACVGSLRSSRCVCRISPPLTLHVSDLSAPHSAFIRSLHSACDGTWRKWAGGGRRCRPQWSAQPGALIRSCRQSLSFHRRPRLGRPLPLPPAVHRPPGWSINWLAGLPGAVFTPVLGIVREILNGRRQAVLSFMGNVSLA